MTKDKKQTVILELSKQNSETQSSPEFQRDIDQTNKEANFECDTNNYILGYN